MGLQLVTGPTSLPVTRDELTPELESWADSGENIQTLTAKLHEAVSYVEAETNRRFIQQTWLQTFDCWPELNRDGRRIFKLDLKPLSSVTTVKYYNADGTLTTLSSTEYWAITNAERPQVAFKPSTFTQPTVEVGRPDAIEVTYVAGYASAAVIPARAKLAIKMLAAYWFEQRKPVASDSLVSPSAGSPTIAEIPYGVKQIINELNASGYV